MVPTLNPTAGIDVVLAMYWPIYLFSCHGRYGVEIRIVAPVSSMPPRPLGEPHDCDGKGGLVVCI